MRTASSRHALGVTTDPYPALDARPHPRNGSATLCAPAQIFFTNSHDPNGAAVNRCGRVGSSSLRCGIDTADCILLLSAPTRAGYGEREKALRWDLSVSEEASGPMLSCPSVVLAHLTRAHHRPPGG
ncbi:hypothetical protein L1887_55274 [Cichorium endivia]|nr:hypothetical protein L1887_55274 [Cichorium endivia]